MFGKRLIFKLGRNKYFKFASSLCYSVRKSYVSGFAPVAEAKTSVARSTEKVNKISFTKNLFVGEYDRDVLTFPEILDLDSTKKIEDFKFSFKELLDNEDNAAVKSKKIITILKTLQDVGLCPLYDKSDNALTATECLRITEYIVKDPSIALLLEHHYSFILKTVLRYGSSKQKEKYLPKLMNGEWFGSYAMYEEISGSDPTNIETSISLHNETGNWILNGQKICLNLDATQFYLVFAKSEFSNRPSSVIELSTVIVDKNENGITIEPLETFGLEDYQLCKVTFNNVLIPKEDMLLESGKGFFIASDNFNTHKFLMSSCISGNMKDVLRLTTSHLKCQKVNEVQDSELLKKKLAEVAIFTYALDSMLYLTAGMIDKYETDTSLESAIIQVFSTKHGLDLINDCIDLIGVRCCIKDFPCEKVWRNMKSTIILSSQICETHKLFISLTGLQHAGTYMNEDIKKIRNPLHFSTHIFKRMLSQRYRNRDSPKLNLELYLQLHPSLKIASDLLEYCVLRFQFAVESLLGTHGSEVVNRQLDLARLSEAVIDIYAMTCVLSRASRSYCTGLQNSDQEVLAANAFCRDAHQRVKLNIQNIIEGNLASDISHLKIGEHVLKSGGYFFEHPLERNIY